MHPPDPRVPFAAERTLLAWLRAGIGLVGLGFVVARFGLFVHALRAGRAEPAPPAAEEYATGLAGIALVFIGMGAMLAAARQHARFLAGWPAHDFPPGYSTRSVLVLTVLVALISAGLAGILAIGLLGDSP
jgi:putative membrane protein